MNADQGLPSTSSALILYEDFASAFRAKNWLEQCTIAGQPAQHWGAEYWSVDLLQYPVMREQISHRTEYVDLLVLSVDRYGALPPETPDWIRSCCCSASRHPFTLALLLNAHDPDLAAANTLVVAADRIAVAARMDFLHIVWDLPVESGMLPELPDPALLEGERRELPPSHWGLNE